MSELVVIGYKGKFAAEEVRLQLWKMQRENLIDLDNVGKKPGSGVSRKPAQRSGAAHRAAAAARQ